MAYIAYNFEYEKKLRVCFIGAGGHSFRNVYPTFQYAPVDLAAICDVNGGRAAAYARQFGARSAYTDYAEMLERERPDAVFIVTSYREDGRVQATEIALDCMRRGAHVWMEKPAAASVSEVEELIETSRQTGKFVLVGLKKMFFPSVEKVKRIIGSDDFGRPTSIYVRYPQSMPPLEERGDPRKMISLLDHIYHPAAIIQYLMGNIARMSYERDAVGGGSVTNLRFESGAVGTLHMVPRLGAGSPLERLEVTGEGANVIVDNGVKVTYYRNSRGKGLGYGRSDTYLVDDEVAPLHWEPEFSLGQLYNKNLFLLGYVQEVLHFCESVLGGTPPKKGTLEQCLQIMKLYEAYRSVPEGTTAVLNE